MEEGKNNKKRILLIVILMVIICLVILILCPKNKNRSGLKDGFITIDNNSTTIVKDLFYITKDKKTLVNLTSLDGLMNLDVVRDNTNYRISTVKNQITVIEGSEDIYLNAIKFSSNDDYNPPVSINGYTYADFDVIMGLLGYENSSQENYDQTIIEITLDKKDDFIDDEYTELVPSVKEEIEKESESEQIEDKFELPETSEEGLDETIPVVPIPTVEDTKEEIETYPQRIPETDENGEITNREDLESIPDKEAEKREEKWEEIKNDLSEEFKDATPGFKQNAYAEISENTFCFNEASLGIYGNTITVSHNTGDGYYLVVQIGADWTDQALNVVSKESKAYYEGLEDIYKKTILKVLGPIEGEKFFTYFKAHADKTVQGGYISAYDEKGNITSVMTDNAVGDGVRASTMELSQWCGRFTDDGFEYNVVRNGDGISIYVF